MKLADWLAGQKPKKMTQDAFGLKVGLTQGRISQIARNGTTDLETAIRIQDATGGDVTLRDLLPASSPVRTSEQAEAAA